MTLFGYELSLRKKATQPLTSLTGYRWWDRLWGPVSEANTGYWQRNIVAVRDTPSLLASSTVYACVTGIATDVAKLPLKLLRKRGDIHEEVEESHGNSPDSTVLQLLQKPNHYQLRIKFIEQWVVSKLLHGNTYVLKQRDERGNVDALYILHPLAVTPYLAENGELFYELKRDVLNQSFEDGLRVPAREIIHDSMVGLWHGLVGVSPLFACANAALLQARIMDSQAVIFGNKGMPGGIITHPGPLTDEAVASLRAMWDAGFTGANAGKVAILADGLKFEAQTLTALNQQLADQLKWTVEDIARAFHYPLSKLAGPQQPYTKPEQSNVSYYQDCLQIHLEWIEDALKDGLSLAPDRHIEFDIENLMRMDIGSLMDTLNKADRTMVINERRRKLGLPPIKGGDTLYLQHQDYPIDVISEREDLAASPAQTVTPPPAATEMDEEEMPADMPQERGLSIEDMEILYAADIRKEMQHA